MRHAFAPPPPMTVDEFMHWPGDGVSRLHQLIDGEPVAINPPAWRHNSIAFELGYRLRLHLERAGRPCVVVPEPGIQPRAGSSTNIRVPDLAVSCNPGQSHWLEQPIVVVEVLSPSSVRETREAVRAYLTIPSVQEVLVIDSRAMRAELLRRQPDGSWPAEPTVWQERDTVELASFGFACDLAALYPA